MQHLKLVESSTTELKREYIDEVRKTIIAFANTDGGDIYIGITDDGKVIGVVDPEEVSLRIHNSIRDSIKPDITLFVKTETVSIENQDIVKITVQRGTNSPYYLASKGIRSEGVYVRQGSSSVPASETAIYKMIKETDGDQYERERSMEQSLTFVETKKEFSRRSVPFGASQLKTLKLMTADGIYTNLGLLFSDQCAHSVKIAMFDGVGKAVFKDRKELQGSLLKQLNEAYEYIDKANRTRSEITGLYRKDHRDYPEEAVREALLNALVHRDYSFSASTLISIFDDRIEFVSIGGLVKGITLDDIMIGVSIARNDALANVCYHLSLVEAYGTGVQTMLRAYWNTGKKPRIEATDNAFRITLPNLNYSGIAEGFTYPESAVLDLFQTMDLISRKNVEEKLEMGQTAAGRLLKTLVHSGALISIGSGKNTRYRRSLY